MQLKSSLGAVNWHLRRLRSLKRLHTPDGLVTSPLSPPQKKFRWSETFSNSTLGMHPKYEFFCRKGFGKKLFFRLKSFLQINPYLGCISRVLLEGLLLRHKFIKYLQAANDKDTYFDCKSNKRRNNERKQISGQMKGSMYFCA